MGLARVETVALAGDLGFSGICEVGRPRAIIDERGGDVLIALSASASAWDVGRGLATEDRFSAIEVEDVVLALETLVRLYPDRVLVVLDGIAGPPTRGDCGNLVEPVLCKPLVDVLDLEEGGSAAPVNAASDCALAASKPVSSWSSDLCTSAA